MINYKTNLNINLRTIVFSFLVFVGFILSISIIYQVISAISDINIPFDTDEADHANAGLEIYWHLTKGSLSSFLTAISSQSFYPPLHSFIVAICYKLFGITLFSSRISSILLLILSAVTLTYSVIRTTNIKLVSIQSAFTLSVTLMLLTNNPIFVENGALCMLELQGVFLCSLILLATTTPVNLASCITISVLSFLLFLTKYNFGIFLIPAISFSYILTDKKLAFIYSLLTFAFIALWLNFTNIESFKYFLTGHPSYAPILSSSNLLFEIKAWFFEYHQSIGIAIVTTILAFLSLTNPKENFALLYSIFGVVGTLVILLMSTTNESRHFIVAAPLMWFMALYVLVRLENYSSLTQILRVLVLVLAIHSSFLMNNKVRKIIVRGMEGHPSYEQAITFLTEKTDPTVPGLVIGNHDKLSIEAVQWYAAKLHNLPYSAVKFDSFPFDAEKVNNSIKRGRNSDDWISNNNIHSDPFNLINSGHYKQILIFRRVGVSDDKAKLIKVFTDLAQQKRFYRKTFGPYEAIYIKL